MRAKKAELTVKFESGQSYSRYKEFGDMDAFWESWEAGRDPTLLFKGLPEDRCQVPHWGYLIKGRMRTKYKGYEEVTTAGEVFYLPPGHIPLMEEDTEFVYFSPKGETAKVFEVVSRNVQAMKKAP